MMRRAFAAVLVVSIASCQAEDGGPAREELRQGRAIDCDDDEIHCASPTVCVDLMSDDRNCGACGFACGAASECYLGRCRPQPEGSASRRRSAPEADTRCAFGMQACASGCVDLQTDPLHCGACDRVCVGRCEDGLCRDPGI